MLPLPVMKSNKALLIIMDGWGCGTVPVADAIAAARTPFIDQLFKTYPHTQLITCGEAVGLPAGQMGNSEVGHLNIGAGRIVYQELQRINLAVRNGELAANPVLLQHLRQVRETGKTLHLMGLFSDGGVHAHMDHLKALVDIAESEGVHRTAIHAFTDGRDTDPKSSLGYLDDFQRFLKGKRARLASLTGRFYAMDRDKRWERIKVAYEALIRGEGTGTTDPAAAIRQAHEAGITDEFLPPVIVEDEPGNPTALIREGDTVICFNFRTDRCREITEALTQLSLPEWDMHPLPLNFVTMTEYDQSFRNVEVLFHKDNLENTLGQVLEVAGKRQIRIAETEKYPHVTFFFSGGREIPFKNEKRILIPSPKEVPTYDLKPEMSAPEITAAILPEIRRAESDFICLNFANTDMVGHTGVWEAAVRAAETVEACVSEIVPAALEHGYGVFLTADHGNADYMRNPDGSPNTAHSLNPVPLILISRENGQKLKAGKLGDLAPTILHYMGLQPPAEMTGENLILDGRQAEIAPAG